MPATDHSAERQVRYTGGPPWTKLRRRQVHLGVFRHFRPRPQRMATLVAGGFTTRAPVTLQLLGKTLLHAALVGAAVGLDVPSPSSKGLDLTQHWVLARLARYTPCVRPAKAPRPEQGPAFRPWLLVVLPGVGAALRGSGLEAGTRDAWRRDRCDHRRDSHNQRSESAGACRS